MAQPPEYLQGKYFTGVPIKNFPGDDLDQEFAGIEASIDGLRANIAMIQRDDGELMNEAVTVDSLSPEVLGMISAGGGEGGGGIEEAPFTSTAYGRKNGAWTAVSEAAHLHTGVYAAASHTHTGVYSPVGHTHAADDVAYVNAGTGLAADNAQDAIDEIDTRLDALEAAPGGVTSVFGETGAIVATAGDYDADLITFDPTGTGLAATDVQAAIEELDTDLANHSHAGVYSPVAHNHDGDYTEEAPTDSNEYVRKNGAWVEPSAAGIADAASDGNAYGRKNAGWVMVSESGHNHAGVYSTVGHTHSESDITDLGAYLEDAPSDGNEYLRKNGAWQQPSAAGIADAPSDGTTYGRLNGAWSAAATAGHNHDASYAALAHNHDADYADIAHNHDADYADIAHVHGAAAVTYSNATSGLTATDAQAAIDEIEGRVDTLEAAPGGVTSIFTRTGAVVAAASDYDADQVDFDPSGTVVVTEADVQLAIEELDAAMISHAHDGTYAKINATDDETTGALKLAVVTALPGSPDTNTIYFVTG